MNGRGAHPAAPEAFRCECGEPLRRVPAPWHLTDTPAKWVRGGWCDSCKTAGRGRVMTVTRRPMRREEEVPVRESESMMEVER